MRIAIFPGNKPGVIHKNHTVLINGKTPLFYEEDTPENREKYFGELTDGDVTPKDNVL